MSTSIRKVAVLGGGIMGSGIAAHLANAGIPSLLLDIVPPKAADGEDTSSKAFRNKFAATGKAKLAKEKPAPLFISGAANLIEVGNFDDDLHRVAECDWIIEAIIENLDIKRGLFAKLEEHLKEGAIISSNTSGLLIEDMVQGRSDAFRKNFLVTHFFNPVRYMKLLELVPGQETDPAAMASVHKFSEEVLGKWVVYCKDTPNFIANRIGIYAVMKTIAEMQKAEMTVEEVDAVFGPAMAKPSSAVFRTADLVGLDTLVHVADNCYDKLVDDEERDIFKGPAWLDKMVEKGLLGGKTGGGFYKKSKDADGKRVIQALDLNTFEYRDKEKVRYDSLGAARKAKGPANRVKAVLAGDDKASKLAEIVTLSTLAYTSRRIPEIADDLYSVDRAMAGGFAWDLGPFEVWDAIGVQKTVDRMAALNIQPADWVTSMLASGRESFYGVDGTATTFWDIPAKAANPIAKNDRAFSVEILKRGEKVIEKNAGATLWDMDDGVTLLEFHTKMNAIDPDIMSMIDTAITITERDFRGLVVGNSADHFSAGANIGLILMAAGAGQFDQIEDMIANFQAANQRLRFSPIPTVCAPAGMALGGGCEVTMACNAVQGAAELYIGLVEVGVGLIPGGGGNLQLLRNIYGPVAADKEFDPFPYLKKAFLSIGMAKVATSAEEGRECGFLSEKDGISMNREFVLSDAKQRAIGMAEAGFRPPRKIEFLLGGPSAKATIDMLLYDMVLNKQISDHDRLIGSKLAGVLTGGDTATTVPVTEERLLELEREAFLSLCAEDLTQKRLFHMLNTGKPLRN